MKNKQTLIGIVIGILGTLFLFSIFHVILHFGFHRGFLPFEEKRFLVPGGFISRNFRHGIVGTIDGVAANTFTVKEKDNEIKQIITDNQTQIRTGTASAKFSDLKKDLKVIVVGEPVSSSSAIKASVIQILLLNERKNIWTK